MCVRGVKMNKTIFDSSIEELDRFCNKHGTQINLKRVKEGVTVGSITKELWS